MKNSLKMVFALAMVTSACAPSRRLVRFHDPLSVDEHIALGSSYQSQGLKDNARHEYQAAVEKDRKAAEAWVALGNIAFEKKKIAVAERYYKRALRADKKNAGAANNLAMCYLATNKLKTAERWAKKSASLSDADRVYALDTLAHIYMKERRYDDAARSLDEATNMAANQVPEVKLQLALSQKELTGLRAETRPNP